MFRRPRDIAWGEDQLRHCGEQDTRISMGIGWVAGAFGDNDADVLAVLVTGSETILPEEHGKRWSLPGLIAKQLLANLEGEIREVLRMPPAE